ncbi:MAG: UDP binding domain-containing protein, partial [Bdellovibrionota bacterium]
GHCIGVDPYYLTHKAEMLGYQPQVILAGRRINDSMGQYVAQNCVKEMIAAGRNVNGARVLIMGLTFKENVEDIRNSKVIDIVRELESFGVKALVWDPVAKDRDVHEEYGIHLANYNELDKLDAVVAAVSHKQIMAVDLAGLAKKTGKGAPFIDVKSAFDRAALEGAGFRVWRL